ncbi:MAG: D-alanyl-D-alanine carboxypeptidase [Tyzzerella sp.]|nr:D-alanyl-D-alanine carboxypeptidase [Tyzzerella sp.]
MFTGKRKVWKKRRKRNLRGLFLVPIIALIGFGVVYWMNSRISVVAFESDSYGTHIYQSTLPVDDLCVTTENVASDAFQTEDELHAAALFQVDEANILYAQNIHEKIYPASTTKIMTAYLAIKYGNLSDIVTVSENAVAVPLDSSRAGLCTGDQLPLEALLYGLMLPSGNDSAVAIAEYISGSEEAFTELMNDEAQKLGATNSHFVTSHGYHDENHYTTAYDLYLIFNECVKYDKFLEVISASEYATNITQANGTYRKVLWRQTNLYVNGTRQVPESLTVVGGKTGTTDEAGACLILYSKDSQSHPYISIVMGADTKVVLYDNMTKLISAINISQ